MEEFQIISPSAVLAPYVKHYWFLRTTSVSQVTQRIVPVGFINLVLHRGEQLYSITENTTQPRSFLGGQGMTYSDLIYSGTVDMISIVFQSIGAKAFFRIPMIEFRENNISLDLIGDNQIMELEKRLTDTLSNQECVQLIERFLLKRLYKTKEYNFQRLSAAIQSINSGQMDIAKLAVETCLSYKQFKRIFAEYVGANPKDFLRVVRFQRALHTMQTNPQTNLAQLAYECDFYDQSHLIKEFKHFSGYTPVEYLSVCDPYSDYFS